MVDEAKDPLPPWLPGEQAVRGKADWMTPLCR